MASRSLAKQDSRKALQKYDPVKGVLSIRAAKEAEKRARRARDLDEVFGAIDRQWDAISDFVLWWDTEAKRWQQRDGGRGNKKTYSKKGTSLLTPEDFNLTVKLLSKWRTVVNDPDKFKKTVEESKEHARTRFVFSKNAYVSAVREAKRAEVRSRLETLAALEAQQPTGQFDVVVIDPPWPMEKIERDERPNQVEFDYPTMSDAELRAIQVPCADDCHVWLWTTHRFLPLAFQLLAEWSLAYVCTFVWHKPGGFQPVGLPQYNCEFALYARKGSPIFLETTNLPTCFEAPRGAHSEKPEAFYEMVRRVTAGRRHDMFNRRQIEGFSGSGKEAA